MVTVTDVAKKAGVSTSTVSRVMSRSGYASLETRDAVFAAAKELGYVPNAIARGLKTQKSGFIAFIMPEILDAFFFTALARGVEEVANQNKFQILLGNNNEDQEKERQYVELMVANAIEGVIMTPSANYSRRTYKVLEEQRIPTVLVDRTVTGFRADTVRSDDIGGAKLLVDHLVELGHQRIAFVNGNRHTSVAVDRGEGFTRAMAAAGLRADERLMSWGPWFIEDAERRVDALITSRHRFTAVVAANLYMAIGTLRALRKRQIRVPEDVSLVSFNDHDVAAELSPFLTALSQPIYSMGRIGMGLLLERIRGAYSGDPRDVVLSPTLVMRRSSGPAAAEDGKPHPALPVGNEANLQVTLTRYRCGA
jgi:LacI family transcriptional regulator